MRDDQMTFMEERDLTQLPETMRALVLSGAGFEHLSVRRVAVPQPGPRQLLARVDAAGICTSLIKLVEQGPAHSQVYGWDLARFPLILGDEGCVTLVEIGKELRGRYNGGERYAIQPAVDHPPINYRERYRDNARGVNKVAVGYTLGGHLAEYVLVPEEVLEAGCLLPLPAAGLPSAHAAMSEPISCCVSAQEHHLHLIQDSPGRERRAVKGLKRGGVTVILGAGVMGRMHVDVAFGWGPRAIVVSDPVGARLDLVSRFFGERARHAGTVLRVLNPRNASLKAAIDELTGGTDADDVIVAVGSRQVIEEAQHLAGRGAVLNLFGGLKKGDDAVPLDTGIVHYKEINVTGSSGGSPWDMARTLELIASGQIDAARHITRIGDLEHAPELIEMVKAQELDGKAVVYPHRRTSAVRAVRGWSAEDEREYLRRGKD